jgi:hypothetical protein
VAASSPPFRLPALTRLPPLQRSLSPPLHQPSHRAPFRGHQPGRWNPRFRSKGGRRIVVGHLKQSELPKSVSFVTQKVLDRDGQSFFATSMLPPSQRPSRRPLLPLCRHGSAAPRLRPMGPRPLPHHAPRRAGPTTCQCATTTPHNSRVACPALSYSVPPWVWVAVLLRDLSGRWRPFLLTSRALVSKQIPS